MASCAIDWLNETILIVQDSVFVLKTQFADRKFTLRILVVSLWLRHALNAFVSINNICLTFNQFMTVITHFCLTNNSYSAVHTVHLVTNIAYFWAIFSLFAVKTLSHFLLGQFNHQLMPLATVVWTFGFCLI